MQITVEKKVLADALASAERVCESKVKHRPILGHVLLRGTAGGLSIHATDGLVALEEKILEVEGVTDGALAVPATSLMRMVRSLPDGPVTVSSLPNHWAKVSSGRTEFKLVGLLPSDFPELPKLDKRVIHWEVAGSALLDLVSHVEASISPDEARVNLNGVLLESDGTTATMVSTDGHRLTKYARPLDGLVLDKGIIIPRRAVIELKKLIGRMTTTIKVSIDPESRGQQRLIVFEDETMTFMTKLTAMPFPPYKTVIPTHKHSTVLVGRDELLGALRRAEVMAPEKTATVRVRLSEGTLELTADNPDLGASHQELAVDFNGEPIEIGANARYLMDALGGVDDEQVEVRFFGSIDPIIFVSGEYWSVVMPMRLL